MKGLAASKLMNSAELDMLKEKLEQILAEKGVIVEHPEALKMLQAGGADVNGSNVRFPPLFLAEVLTRLPERFILAGREQQHDLYFPHPENLFYTRTNTGALYYLDEGNLFHPLTLDEAAEFTRLADHLPGIDFCSLPSTQSENIPPETLDIHTLYAVLQNTGKHIWVQPYGKESISYLLKIAEAAAGSRDQLKSRPIISMIACSHTPLTFKAMDMEVIMQCCQAGIPIQACALPAAGANAPVTPEGCALLASAEVMAMAVMAQVIMPGIPVIATPLLFSIDMATTATLQSPVEVTMGRMLAIQLFKEGYGIPVHTYGTGSDSVIPDGQNMIERTSTAHMVALAGADILGGAGQLQTAKTVSPLQLIIDSDIFGMVKKLKTGLGIDAQSLAFNEIMGLTGREAFINMDHTFRYFRDTFRPQTFFSSSRRDWEKQGRKDLIARSREIYDSIRKGYRESSLPDDLAGEIKKIIAQADRELGGR